MLFYVGFYVEISEGNQYIQKSREEKEFEEEDENHDDSKVQEVEVTPQRQVRLYLGDSDGSETRLSQAPPA